MASLTERLRAEGMEKGIEQGMALGEDDFELEDDYDFSNGVRSRFYSAKKVSTTIRLDNDVVLLLKKQAAEKHIGYQTLINAVLRDYSMHSVHGSGEDVEREKP